MVGYSLKFVGFRGLGQRIYAQGVGKISSKYPVNLKRGPRVGVCKIEGLLTMGSSNPIRVHFRAPSET